MNYVDPSGLYTSVIFHRSATCFVFYENDRPNYICFTNNWNTPDPTTGDPGLPGGGGGGGGGDKDCTILVRGRNGAALSKGNKLRFPYTGSRQVLGADDNKVQFGWKVEIIGRVLDGSDANDWKVLQTVERVDSFLSFSGSWVSRRSSVDENLSSPEVYKNQVSGNTRYALDSPGLKKDSQLTTMRLKANFTTKFTNGESTCTAEWSMTLDVRNNVLMGAEWFDHHISLD